MKAIIEVDVPDYQIGQMVSIYFKDTMMIKGVVQGLSGDLISRQAVLDILPKYKLGESRIAEEVNDLPSVNPQEPKTGHWISMDTEKQSHTKDGMTIESVKCSECDEWLTASDEYACYGRYCPNCGARMESEDDNT